MQGVSWLASGHYTIGANLINLHKFALWFAKSDVAIVLSTVIMVSSAVRTVVEGIGLFRSVDCAPVVSGMVINLSRRLSLSPTL